LLVDACISYGKHLNKPDNTFKNYGKVVLLGEGQGGVAGARKR